MASVSTDRTGRRRILFVDAEGARKTIRLGKVPKKDADRLKGLVERLHAARITGSAIDADTARDVAQLADALHARFAAVGLVAARQAMPEASAVLLGQFTREYIDRRTDVKPRTKTCLESCRTKLVAFFGADKPLAAITKGDANNWLLWLRERYANGTAGRTVKRAKQFFIAAIDAEVVSRNPFHHVKPPSQVNSDRAFFVTQETTRRLLDACPDIQWRTLIALSRYGGLRVPSESMELTWPDVNWERGRFWVTSPKTEHHEGKEGRWVPLFPELRAVLEEAFDAAPEGALHVLSLYRAAGTSANLRTQLLRIIKRASLTPWPKLFQNMRATRETELTATYPLHIVTAWLGNSALVAQRHYLQVRDSDYEKAAATPTPGGAESDARATQNPAQQEAAPSRTTSPATTQARLSPGFVPNGATPCETVRSGQVALEGVEQLRDFPGETHNGPSGGAESGAVPADPDLARIIEAWARLSERTKTAVMALVSASGA